MCVCVCVCIRDIDTIVYDIDITKIQHQLPDTDTLETTKYVLRRI